MQNGDKVEGEVLFDGAKPVVILHSVGVRDEYWAVGVVAIASDYSPMRSRAEAVAYAQRRGWLPKA